VTGNQLLRTWKSVTYWSPNFELGTKLAEYLTAHKYRFFGSHVGQAANLSFTIAVRIQRGDFAHCGTNWSHYVPSASLRSCGFLDDLTEDLREDLLDDAERNTAS